MFQGDQRDTESRESLVFTVSGWEAFDSHIVGSDTIGSTPIDSDVKRGGNYSIAQASVLYDKRGRRWTFGSGLNSRFAYYPNFARDIQQPIDSYDGVATLSGQFGRARLTAAQTLAYQPYFMVQALPLVIGPDNPLLSVTGAPFSPEVAILDNPATTHSSSASFTTELSRRTSIAANYGYQSGNYGGQFVDISNQSAGLELTQGISRSTEIFGRYTYEHSDYDRAVVTSAIVGQSVSGGVRHTRRLSASRTARLYGGLGASLLHGEFSTVTGNTTARQATAHAGLDLQLGRSWDAQAQFRRSLQLLQGLSQPYYGNAVTAAAGGLLARRLELVLAGAYAQGNIGVEALSPGYDTRNASIRLRYGLSRQLAISTEYVNSDYDFGKDAILPPGIVRRLNRHTARVGMTWGTLLIGRPMRP